MTIVYTMHSAFSLLLCALCGTALDLINDTVQSNSCSHRWCTSCIALHLLSKLKLDGVTPTCNACKSSLTDGLLRISTSLTRSGATKTMRVEIDVPESVEMVSGANGAYLLRPDNIAMPPLLRAFAGEPPGAVAPVDAAYIAIGARVRLAGPDGRPDDNISFLDALLSGSEGGVTKLRRYR